MTMSRGYVLAIAVLATALVSQGCGDDGEGDVPSASTPIKTDRSASTRGEGVEEEQARIPKADVHATEINKLPKNFPKDVPVFPGSAPTAALVSDGNDMVVSFSTEASPGEVFGFFRDALGNRDWEIESQAESPLHASLVTKKDQRTATLLVMTGPTGTHITLTIAEE